MIEFDGTCGTCAWWDSCAQMIYDATGQETPSTVPSSKEACDRPTERRAALIAQLSQDYREALELGCRVRAMPRDVNLDDMGREWFAVKRGYSIGRGKTPLNALRNANIGNGWDEKGNGEKGETNE